MTSRSWIRRLFARKPRTIRKAPARCHPAVEALENRIAPSLTPPGYYSADGQAPGIPAPPGTYVAVSGATAPTTDPLGYYTDQPASVAPIPAPAGSYVATEGATSATLDPVGTYTDLPGAAAPIPAPAGSFVDVIGATVATLDPVGTYTDQPGAAVPIPAPAGSYVDTTGATATTLDPVGTYTEQPGATAPLPAPAGSYVDTLGATSATLDPVGTYTDQPGATAPIPAPPGSYVAAEGATSATLDPAGTYTDQPGATAPMPAPAGSYVATEGATSATLDPVGTYTDQPGATAPIPAPAGSYVATLGATAATLDPAGTYTDQPGAALPIPAPAGSFVATVGATAATLAPAGYYVPVAGATAPTPASPGFYVPTAGETQEIPDPPGTTSGVAATAPTPVSVNPVNLTYGTALANSQLSGTVTSTIGGNPISVAGTFTYTTAAGTILNASTGQSEAVTFTPDDSTHYATASTTVAINVAPRPLTVTADPQSKTAGTADPPLTYRVTAGNLVGSDALSGSLSRDPGEAAGAYPIRQGSLTAGPNYALTFVNSVLLVTAASAPLQSDQTVGVSSTAGPSTATTTPASPGGPQLSATGSGFDGALTVAQYQGAPVAGFAASGSYFDVNVGSSDLGAGSSVQVVISNLTPGATVFWMNGGSWQPVTDAAAHTVTADATGTATVTLTTATSPTPAQLTGTPVFAGKFQPTLSVAAGAPAVAGTGVPLTATATLTAGDAASVAGSITFTLLDLGGTRLDVETIPVAGNGTYQTPKGFVPPAAGTSYWVATYGGDGNNNPVTAPVQAGVAWTLNQGFVNQVYQDLLHRPAEPAGLAAWSGALDQGWLTRSQVALLIEASPESRGDQVQALYQQYLHRAADPTGLAGFTGFLLHGGTVEQVAALLAGSAEYFQRAGGTTGGFVQDLFADALGRPATAAEQQPFTSALTVMSRQQAAAALLGTPEYEQDRVEGFYDQYLHRSASPAEATGWASGLHAGLTDEQVIAAMLSSAECLALV